MKYSLHISRWAPNCRGFNKRQEGEVKPAQSVKVGHEARPKMSVSLHGIRIHKSGHERLAIGTCAHEIPVVTRVQLQCAALRPVAD